MKGFEVFLVLALTGVCVFAKFEHGLKVTFAVGANPEDGQDFFWHIPLNISAAVRDNWELTESPAGYHPALVLYSKDPTMSTYYDKGTGFIAGIRICVNQKEFTGLVFDWKSQGYTKMTIPTKEGEPIEYQCTELHFVSGGSLDKPVEERIASITSNQILRENKIWMQSFNGHMDELSTDISKLDKSKWTKQACVPWMGQHYYYNMSAETLCEDDKLHQWFVLTDNEFSGGIVGVGHMTFGKQPKNKWFETPPKLAVQTIVPRGPQCLFDLAEKPGLFTMHIYFVDNPWSIGCNVLDMLG